MSCKNFSCTTSHPSETTFLEAVPLYRPVPQARTWRSFRYTRELVAAQGVPALRHTDGIPLRGTPGTPPRLVLAPHGVRHLAGRQLAGRHLLRTLRGSTYLLAPIRRSYDRGTSSLDPLAWKCPFCAPVPVVCGRPCRGPGVCGRGYAARCNQEPHEEPGNPP